MRSKASAAIQVLLDHPAAAAGDDLVEGQVGVEVAGTDPAGRDEAQHVIRRRQSLQRRQAADRLGREELQHFEAVFESQCDVRGGGDAGRDRHATFAASIDHAGAAARGDDELGAGRDRGVDLLGRQHRAGADQDLGHLRRDPPDRLFGGGGPEGDLRHRQSAGGPGPWPTGRHGPRRRWRQRGRCPARLCSGTGRSSWVSFGSGGAITWPRRPRARRVDRHRGSGRGQVSASGAMSLIYAAISRRATAWPASLALVLQFLKVYR